MIKIDGSRKSGSGTILRDSATMLAMAVLPLALFADGPSVYRIFGGLFQDFADRDIFSGEDAAGGGSA